MVLRCFAKCPSRSQWWGICRGAQEAIWHHCKELLRYVPNHHQLGPCKPSTFAGSTHLVNAIVEAGHPSGNVRICTRHWRWHASNWPLLGTSTFVPTPNRDDGGWQSTGDSLWVYRHGNHSTGAGLWWYSGQPSLHTNSSSTPSRPK